MTGGQCHVTQANTDASPAADLQTDSTKYELAVDGVWVRRFGNREAPISA